MIWISTDWLVVGLVVSALVGTGFAGGMVAGWGLTRTPAVKRAKR